MTQHHIPLDYSGRAFHGLNQTEILLEVGPGIVAALEPPSTARGRWCKFE